MNNTTQEGIDAYKAGDKGKARSLFEQAIQQNEQDTQAWLGLAAIAHTPAKRLEATMRVLQLDDGNASAMKRLARMISRGEVVVQLKEETAPITTMAEEDQIIFQVHPSMILMAMRVIAIFGVLILLIILAFASGGGLLGGLFLFFAVGLFIIIIPVIFFAFFTYRAIEYTLTAKHLVVSSGIFNRSRKTIPIQRIQDVVFEESLLERMFGLGHVTVKSAGEFSSIKLRELADSHERAEQILQLIDRSR